MADIRQHEQRDAKHGEPAAHKRAARSALFCNPCAHPVVYLHVEGRLPSMLEARRRALGHAESDGFGAGQMPPILAIAVPTARVRGVHARAQYRNARSCSPSEDSGFYEHETPPTAGRMCGVLVAVNGIIGMFSRETFLKPLNSLRIDRPPSPPYIAAHDDDAPSCFPPPPCHRGTGGRARVIVLCRRTLAPRRLSLPKFAVAMSRRRPVDRTRRLA